MSREVLRPYQCIFLLPCAYRLQAFPLHNPCVLCLCNRHYQHSQIQLYNEGPNNKVITFIRVGEFDTNLEIPNIFEYTGIGYLGGKTINDLMNAEADSTRVSLADYLRPTVTINLDCINAYNLAQLLYMFEIQTAVSGSLYNIDAFNQPGVEQAKNYTYALMGRSGYEESASEIQGKMLPV